MNVIYASVLLQDGKIAGWNVGETPKRSVGDYSKIVNVLASNVSAEDISKDGRELCDMFKKYDFIEKSCEVITSEFQYRTSKERAYIFDKLAPMWYSQWELADNYSEFNGFLPYIIM